MELAKIGGGVFGLLVSGGKSPRSITFRANQKLRQQGLKCYLATNNEKYRVEFVSRKMGFNKYFDQVFSSSALGYKKPQPEFFQAVWQKIGQPAKQSVFFTDDSRENILAARAFGFRSLVYPGFNKFTTALQNLVLAA